MTKTFANLTLDTIALHRQTHVLLGDNQTQTRMVVIVNAREYQELLMVGSKGRLIEDGLKIARVK